jgi:putative ABC transport system permease protein
MWGGSPPYAVHKTKNGVFSVGGAFAGVERHRKHEDHRRRSINGADTKERRKVVLIGKRVRDQLFVNGRAGARREHHHQRINFLVIGVSESLQQGNSQQEDEKVYIPTITFALCVQPDRLGRQLHDHSEARPSMRRSSKRT